MVKPSHLVAGAGLLAAGALALWPPPGLPVEGARAGALVVATVVLLATGALPEFVTAILFFVVAMLFAVAPAEVVFSGFHSAGFWIVFGGLVIGVGVRGTGLAGRLAHAITGRFGRRYAAIITGMVVVGVALSFLMPSTMGRILILMPIVLAMADGFGYGPGSNGRAGLVLASSFGTMIPGFAILPATLPAVVLIGASQTQFGIAPVYGTWLLLHFPVLGILKAVAIIVLTIWLFPEQDAKATPAVEAPGAMAGRERLMVLLLSLALVLWMTDFLHHISPAWVAMGVAAVIVLPFVGIVSPQDFDSKLNFASLFYVGGVLGLGGVMAHGGLGDWLAQNALELLDLRPGRDGWNFAAVSTLSSLLAMLATQPSAPAILTPLAPHIAEATALPIETVLMMIVVGFSALVLPYQTPPLVVAMQLGSVPMRQGNKLCLALLAVTVVLLLPLDYLWWRALGWFG